MPGTRPGMTNSSQSPLPVLSENQLPFTHQPGGCIPAEAATIPEIVSSAFADAALEMRVPFGSRMAASARGGGSNTLSPPEEEHTMPTYRVYLIDGNDRVASYRPLEAETDAEAISAARQFVDGCDVEVWHLDRKIGRLERGGK